MADPDAVPAGLYGKAALRHLGIWDSVAPKVARAENVRAALALVERSAAPFGIVYATDAKASRRVKVRSEEHTSELQSLMRISYAVFCLKKKKITTTNQNNIKKLYI